MYKVARVVGLFNFPVLLRYVLAATLARTATGGSTVAVILLANQQGASGQTAGALAACLTFPHLLGPLFGRWLDNARDPRRLLIAAAFIYAGFFQLAIMGFNQHLMWLTVTSLLICGTCSSFLMGGLSTQLTGLVGPNRETRRRAQNWDAITYAMGITAGPLVVAVLSGSYSTQMALTLLMLLPILAGICILSFPAPATKTGADKAQIQSVGQVMRLISRSAPLRTTIIMTSVAACSVAALPVLAVYLAKSWQSAQEQGAYLVTCYGIGTLCGGLLLMVKPLRADALTLLKQHAAILLLTLIGIGLSPSLPVGLFTYWLCGLVNALFFASTLAARSEYAPEQVAAQVYMWVAAAKISAASLGALIAGYLVDKFVLMPLILSFTMLGLAHLLCFRFGINKQKQAQQAEINQAG
ncbi:MFS transporter [Bowmanella denitrificans]|uniref:MFS transporter n=1 Tax=Bowmanella denitrificans TaxID=366582 RepID=UPI000C9B2BD0|nr:MFS transporter [Bowmanella denitrificans]